LLSKNPASGVLRRHTYAFRPPRIPGAGFYGGNPLFFTLNSLNPRIPLHIAEKSCIPHGRERKLALMMHGEPLTTSFAGRRRRVAQFPRHLAPRATSACIEPLGGRCFSVKNSSNVEKYIKAAGRSVIANICRGGQRYAPLDTCNPIQGGSVGCVNYF
jgi:hypothetical protein